MGKPRPKTKETGAYPDKEGRHKDVLDLLDSDEVKTFGKLKWGGAPVSFFMGLCTVRCPSSPNPPKPTPPHPATPRHTPPHPATAP